MEKIIFFGLVIPIFMFVLYLGGNAIMKGFKAKSHNKSNISEEEGDSNIPNDNVNLSDEISQLNKLHKSGALTNEEFEKAKQKILGD
tara:strand:- start:1068 stop:1328 length:261 start_codon:yes stop_codon:yes gene_type:complete